MIPRLGKQILTIITLFVDQAELGISYRADFRKKWCFIQIHHTKNDLQAHIRGQGLACLVLVNHWEDFCKDIYLQQIIRSWMIAEFIARIMTALVS